MKLAAVPMAAALAAGGALTVGAVPAYAGNPELAVCTYNWGGSGARTIEARWEPPKNKAPQWTMLRPKVLSPDYEVCGKTVKSSSQKYKTKIKLGQHTYGVKWDPNGNQPKPRVCVYVLGRFTPDCNDKSSAGVKLPWTEMNNAAGGGKRLEVPVKKAGWEGTNLRLAWSQFRNRELRETFNVYVCQTKTLNDDDWPCTNPL